MKKNSGYIISRLLLYGCVSIISVFIVAPLIWIVLTSIQPLINMASINEGGLDLFESNIKAYINMFKDQEFIRAIYASLIISVGTTLFTHILAIPATYAAVSYKYMGRDAILFSTLIMQMSPGIVMMIPIFMLLRSINLIDTYIGQILVFAVFLTPVTIWMLRGYFREIPRELRESARIDGCTRFQTIYHVILPIAKPGIFSTVLFNFIASWNELFIPLILSFTRTKTMIVYAANFSSHLEVDYASMAAVAILSSIIPVIIVLSFKEYIISGFIEGSIKG